MSKLEPAEALARRAYRLRGLTEGYYREWFEKMLALVEARDVELVRRVLERVQGELVAPAWDRLDETRPTTWRETLKKSLRNVQALDPAAVLRELTDGD